MNFFEYVKNDSFFKPLTLKYKRIYYDCIQILIDKTKELPVLYETDAKDSLTVYLKNVGMGDTRSSLLEDIAEGDEMEIEENGIELQPSEIISLFRECGWLLPREIGRNGEYVVNISIDCRRFMDFLRKMTEKSGEGMMSNRIFSMYEIIKSVFEEDSVRRERPYTNILVPLIENETELKNELVELKDNISSIMKFVLNIYETAKDARNDIADINKELRKLQFSTKYQFDVKMLSDNSDYAKILRYAEYLQDTNNMSDGQMTFTSLMGYENDEVEIREKEIRDIINKIIDHNDIAEIKKFADYRNYMSYEIIINNDEVKDGKLSKQVGYNSGAGTQIPYTLILSAALSMLYNVRVNSVRLIFIDEPFEKMSDHNIKLMLDFFKNQNFQVIFCAPPNKLESIGSECGVIIPVLKYSNDNMQIGEIRFHE